MLSLWYNDYSLVTFFLLYKISQEVGMKMRIIPYFGNGTRSVSFFLIVSEEDH